MACAQRAPCLTASVFLPVLAFGGALPGCATRQVLEDNESLLNYGIHRHSVIHHKAVRQRTYSDVDYAELSRFTEDMQRKKRYGVPCHGCHMHTRSTASPQHATVYHRLYCLICPPPPSFRSPDCSGCVRVRRCRGGNADPADYPEDWDPTWSKGDEWKQYPPGAFGTSEGRAWRGAVRCNGSAVGALTCDGGMNVAVRSVRGQHLGRRRPAQRAQRSPEQREHPSADRWRRRWCRCRGGCGCGRGCWVCAAGAATDVRAAVRCVGARWLCGCGHGTSPHCAALPQ